MVNKSKKISIVFILILLLSLYSVAIYGSEQDNSALAEYLNKMGLIQGTGQGFDLDAVTTRGQGAVMVVRLMGKETEALKMNYTHPFTDVPTWADAYIGYLWENGISKGIDNDTYGTDLLMSPPEYMTFMIRVLGYDDTMGDFSWNTSLQKANELGILTTEEYQKYKLKNQCLRNDMILFSYRALDTDLKNGKGASLLRKLMDEKDVPQTAMLDYVYAPFKTKSRIYTPKNDEEMQKALIQSMLAFETKLVLDIKGSSLSSFNVNWDQAMIKINQLPGYYAIISGCNYSASDKQATITFKYTTTKSRYDQAVKKALEVGNLLIDAKMTDYERELSIHDYIVDHTVYVDEGNISRNIEGIFLQNKAVCGGYAQAFYYLTTYAGLDSEFVLGDGIQDGQRVAHAWNTVEVEGDWYQVDVTWDDPVLANGSNKKSYSYFNLTNAEMGTDHIWDTNAYAIAKGTKHNYYAFNNQTVYGLEGLKGALSQGFNNKQSTMTFKVIGETVSSNQLKSILNEYNIYKSLTYSVASKGVVEITNIIYN